MIRRAARLEIGLALSTHAVRAVVVRKGVLVERWEVEVSDAIPLATAIAMAIARVPRSRFGRTPFGVAIGPEWAQLRRLRDLPAVRSPRVLAEVVRESASRYFVRRGALVTTTITADGEGGWWAGAVDASVVRLLSSLVGSSGLRLLAIAPTAALLPCVLGDGDHTWEEDDVVFQLATKGHVIRECRLRPAVPGHPALPPTVSSLVGDTARFADAYAAARGARAVRIAIREGAGIDAGAFSQARVHVAGTALAIAFVGAAFAPLGGALMRERAGEAALASRSRETPAALRTQRALRDSSRLLLEIGRFQRESPSILGFVAALSQQIEPPTSLTTLHVNAEGGSLVATTPNASELLAALTTVPRVAAPRIAGAITPVATSALTSGPGAPIPDGPMVYAAPPHSPPAEERPMQRVSVQFTWSRQPGSASSASTGSSQ